MTNVVDIGELRITRQRRQWLSGQECPHKHFTIHETGDMVICDDCTRQISAVWALAALAEEYLRAIEKLGSREQQHREALAKGVSLRAAQRVEQAWRSRSMVPCCPHCREAIFPEDGFGGSTVNREIAQRRRALQGGGDG